MLYTHNTQLGDLILETYSTATYCVIDALLTSSLVAVVDGTCVILVWEKLGEIPSENCHWHGFFVRHVPSSHQPVFFMPTT